MAKKIDPQGNERERWAISEDDFWPLIDNMIAVQTASGQWFIRLELDGEIQLDENRSVIVERKISVRVAQKGRKPRTVQPKVVKGKKGFQK